MANCKQCGAQLPTFSFGEASPYCSDCRAQTPKLASAKKPSIEEALGTIGQERSRWLNATNALILINVAVFMAMVATGVSWMDPTSKDIFKWGANYGPSTLSGQYWRAITAGFVHIGIIHLALNMWCLWYLGRLLERLIGPVATAGVYLVTAVGASLLSLSWSPMRMSAGASGAIFGIAGTLIAVLYTGKLNLEPANKRRLLGYVVRFSLINLLYGLRGNTDNMAHLGGLVTGLIAGLFLARSFTLPQEDRNAQRRNVLVAAALSVAMVFAFVARAKSYVGELSKGQTALEKEDPKAAIEHLKKFTAAQPGNAYGHALLGTAFQDAKQLSESAQEYERSLQLEPSYTYVQLNLARVYLGLNQPEKAVPMFKAGFVGNTSPDADSYYWYAMALKQTGDLQQAEQAVRRSIELNSKDDDAKELLADILKAERARSSNRHP